MMAIFKESEDIPGNQIIIEGPGGTGKSTLLSSMAAHGFSRTTKSKRQQIDSTTGHYHIAVCGT